MKIAVLNRHFSNASGGAERYSVALVEQLAARHEMHVFAQQIHHQWPGVVYHRISTPLRRPRWINQLWFASATWLATRRGYDVVHSHENTWHGDVQTVHVLPVRYTLFHRISGWKLLLRWMNVITSPRLLTYLALERARFASKRCQVIVTSDSLGRIMQSTYPDIVQRMSVIMPGVTMPNQLGTSAISRDRARVQLGLPPDIRCLLFIGNDFRKKGLATLLEALTQLPDRTALAVVGNSPQMPEFVRQVSNLGLSARVYFLGSLMEIRPAYEAADTLVHPTREDTFGMVVLEALSYGLPVVVSAAEYCGISGLLTDRVNALLLQDPKDVSCLVKTLRQLAESRGAQESLSGAAIEFAGLHAWPALASAQEAIYRGVSAMKKTASNKST